MPIKIVRNGSREEVGWLCDNNWRLPDQLAELEAWLARNKGIIESGSYTADVGFAPRAEAMGGGGAVSLEMMRTMVDVGMDLWLSEYPPMREPVFLNLVVLRCSDLERAEAFYGLVGLKFSRHRHGNGPEHLTAELDRGVLEIYPVSKEFPETRGVRIGLSVPSVDAVIASLQAYPEAIASPAKASEWGRRAVLIDPGGHRVELLEC